MLLRSLLLVLLSFSFWTTHAQLQVGVSLLQPLKTRGEVFKPAPVYTLGYSNALYPDDPMQMLFYVGYYSFATRQDTFFASTSTAVSPVYETFDEHFGIVLGGAYDYRLRDTDLSPALGVNILVRSESYEYIKEGRYLSSSETRQEVYVGVTPKTGLSYVTEFWLFSAWVGYAINYNNEGWLYYWQAGLTTTYFFD